MELLGVVYVILRFAVLVQYWRMTDGRTTDGQRTHNDSIRVSR